MRIIIHRGINQIGGCITEIATDDTRILIDLGQNLPDNQGNINDHFQSKEAIENLCENLDAIFYTHYHGDHIGLMGLVPSKIEQYIGSEAKEVMLVKAKYLRHDMGKTALLKTFKKQDRIIVGDIIVTPFLVSHSACDSYMFLIEANNIRILHTGDFRDHGYLGKGLMPTIRKYIGQIDFLITEGTMLSRSNENVLSEYDLQVKAKQIMKQFKYVFILGSSTDIDRIATFHKANPRKRLFVCDSYQSKVLDVFSENSGSYSDLYKFTDLSVFPNSTLKAEMLDKGFAMLIRCNRYDGKYSKFVKLMIDAIPESERLLIYSMWGGYVDTGKHQKSEYVELLAKFTNMERIHTSGHASIKCLTEVCNLTQPKMGIIPIHRESSADFSKLPIRHELKSKILLSSFNNDTISVFINKYFF